MWSRGALRKEFPNYTLRVHQDFEVCMERRSRGHSTIIQVGTCVILKKRFDLQRGAAVSAASRWSIDMHIVNIFQFRGHSHCINNSAQSRIVTINCTGVWCYTHYCTELRFSWCPLGALFSVYLHKNPCSFYHTPVKLLVTFKHQSRHVVRIVQSV